MDVPAHIAEAVALLRQAKQRHGNKLVYPCSLGAEGVVLIDLICRYVPGIRIMTLDTGRLPQATYDLMEAVRKRYRLDLEVILPRSEEVEDMVRRYGPNLFYDSVEKRKLCCEVRKVRPLARALAGMEAWITGRRCEQSAERAGMSAIEDDAVFGLIKYNPLRHWTWQQVWDYIRAFDVPYNRLHDEHYVSIGCAPCTRAIAVGEDPRAGRWWWEQEAAAECGLHMSPIKKGEGEGGDGI